jgi:hypothetical protein
MRQRNAEKGAFPAHRSNSACFHRSSWITTSTTPGGYDVGRLPFETRKIPVCWARGGTAYKQPFLKIDIHQLVAPL